MGDAADAAFEAAEARREDARNERDQRRHEAQEARECRCITGPGAGDEVSAGCPVHGTCTCHPCTTPAYGAPGYDHCAACCYGTGIDEYDPECVVPEHAELGRRQFPPPKDEPVVTDFVTALRRAQETADSDRERVFLAYSQRGPVDCRTHWSCADLGCVDVGVGVIHHPHCGASMDDDEGGPSCRCEPGDAHPECDAHFAEPEPRDPWLTHYDPFTHGRL